jgi:ABC-type uncharacterized transport system permease subunit
MNSEVVSSINWKTILAVTGAGIVVYLFFKREAGAALKAVGQAVNPVSDKNLAYQGVNAVGSAITGDKAWTLGGAIYDLFHADFDPNAPMKTNNLTARSDADGRPTILR